CVSTELEGRPREQGRYVVVRGTDDRRHADITPVPFNARTRVHEYGGGAWTGGDGSGYFSNFSDGRLHRQQRAEPEPQPPPPAPGLPPGSWTGVSRMEPSPAAAIAGSVCARITRTRASRSMRSSPLISSSVTGPAASSRTATTSTPRLGYRRTVVG